MTTRLLFLAMMFFNTLVLTGQNDYITDPSIINAELIKTSRAVSEIQISPKLSLDTSKFAKPGYHQKGDWPLNDFVDFSALPVKNDLQVQKSYPAFNTNKSLSLDFDGIGPTNVDPADPSIAVGPDHVVQMVNAPSGAKIKVWNKDGSVLWNESYFDAITGINGAGDPIVLYDERADRWLLTEFSSIGFKLVVAVSVSPDPLGSYHIYSFDTPDFPDYPKYGIWSNAYFITTNEDGESGVYALDRTKMLAGDPNVTAQRFTIPEFPTINFQAATPVGMVGTNLPASETGLIMRMADDAWSTAIPHDRLEIWEFNVDFENENNTTLTGPITLNTEPFDSHLCGYTSYSCIEQPESVLDLDPLREVLMNKVAYRNFDSYESIVCSHVTDVDGNDRAGIRWYELRNEGAGWFIYQQSTYAPDYDNASRWMSSMNINEDGTIGLAFNISSSSIYPSIRYTGRTECDPINMMTYPETTIKDGTSKNNSTRWGDYTCLDVDPIDGTFWFTAGYAVNTSWDTHIGKFNIANDCFGISLEVSSTENVICQGDDLIIDFELSYDGGYSGITDFEILNFPSQLTGTFSDNAVNIGDTYSLTISNTSSLSSGTYMFDLTATSGDDEELKVISITIDEPIMTATQLISPIHNGTGLGYLPLFEWNDTENAFEYELELACNESFDHELQVFSDIFTSEFMLLDELNQNSTYFWRVKAYNACGDSDYSEIYSFTTGGDSCSELFATDTPLVLPTSGTPTTTSTINYAGFGTVNAISISNIDINHSYISDLRIKLISPSGTEVVLLDGICGSSDDLYLGLEDNGITPFNCPATDNLLYAPNELFSNLINEEANGDWILSVKDKYNYDGGSLNGWTLNLCTAQASSCDPVLEITENPISDGMYEASENIMSTGMIPINGNVNFKAGQSVLLESGFEIQSGSIFELTIGNCNN